MRESLIAGFLLGCVPVERDTSESVDPPDFSCPPWASISPVGSIRTFETTDGHEARNGVSGGFVSEVIDSTSSVSGLETHLVVDGTSDSDSWESYSYRTRSTYRCDGAGAWLVLNETSSTMVTSEITVESTVSTEYVNTFLMPSVLELGDSWRSVFSGTSTSNSGTATDFSYVIESEVTAQDTVRVEAGSYEALVIVETFEDGTRSEYRVASGPGFLVSEDYELVDYTAP